MRTSRAKEKMTSTPTKAPASLLFHLKFSQSLYKIFDHWSNRNINWSVNYYNTSALLLIFPTNILLEFVPCDNWRMFSCFYLLYQPFSSKTYVSKHTCDVTWEPDAPDCQFQRPFSEVTWCFYPTLSRKYQSIFVRKPCLSLNCNNT